MAHFIDISTNHNFSISLNDLKGMHTNPSFKAKLIKSHNKFDFLTNYFTALKSGENPLVLNNQIPDFEKHFPHLKDSTSQGHFICTSGTTTSTPKIYFFEKDKFIGNAKAHNESLSLNKKINILFPLPFTHSFGVVIGLWGTLLLEANCYYSENALSINNLLKSFEEKDLVYLTPSIVKQIIKFAKRYSGSLYQPSMISIGSSILKENEAYELQKIFPKSQLYYTYGLTEMGPRVSTNKLTKLQNLNQNLNLGKPIRGVQMFNRDSLLWVKSPYAFKGTSEVFNTNDKITDDFSVIGRSDDTIIYQGKNIYPDEIESLLLDFPANALIGVDSVVNGQTPLLIFEEEVDTKLVWDRLKRSLPESHLPKKIIIEESFPRTEMNKIKRRELSQRVSAKL